MTALATISWISIALGIATALVIAADVRRHPQPMGVMNVTWPITGLYFPVLGIWMYWRMGRPAARGGGENKPYWQSVFVSATHCGGGCTLGDSIAAPLVRLTGFTVAGSLLYGHFVGEFIGAYLFGILFQYLPIRAMSSRSRWQALWDAVRADTLSLLAFEVGMFGFIAVMFIGVFRVDPQVSDPTYWFMMQIAMIVGFCSTFPANWWLVKAGIKHAM